MENIDPDNDTSNPTPVDHQDMEEQELITEAELTQLESFGVGDADDDYTDMDGWEDDEDQDDEEEDQDGSDGLAPGNLVVGVLTLVHQEALDLAGA